MDARVECAFGKPEDRCAGAELGVAVTFTAGAVTAGDASAKATAAAGAVLGAIGSFAAADTADF
jgi:hypothetical protein